MLYRIEFMDSSIGISNGEGFPLFDVFAKNVVPQYRRWIYNTDE